MKKFVYILVFSMLFAGCNTISQPDIAIAPALPGPVSENTLNDSQPYNLDVQAVPPGQSISSAANPNYDSASLSMSNKTDFKSLYKIYLKNYGTINIFLKENIVFLTAGTSESISIKSMKQLEINSAGSSKLLVNKDNPLPEDFAPQNLVNIDSGKVKLEYPELKLLPVTLKALYSMTGAAKKENVKGFIINSAYRSLTTQKQIFDSNLSSFKKNSKTYEEAYAKTRQLVALPGKSEHHTGLAADIFSVNGRHRNDFVSTKEQVWLNMNLQKYGFIIRYPKDKTKETAAVFEPWHIRYVGIPLSTYMKEQNLCLEEFYARIFADDILEDSKSMFMGIKSTQRVFTDEALVSKISLEKVNEKNALLTLKLG